MFCGINGHALEVQDDDTVNAMLAVAAGEMREPDLAGWISDRLV